MQTGGNADNATVSVIVVAHKDSLCLPIRRCTPSRAHRFSLKVKYGEGSILPTATGHRLAPMGPNRILCFWQTSPPRRLRGLPSTLP